MPPETVFTQNDAERAFDEWGANCGPGALAAIMGMSLDEVRPHMGDFERKHYTNPTLMNDALRSIGRRWIKIGACWPTWGLVRIQWEGPWTNPGVPMRVRYRYTHWIGAAQGASPSVLNLKWSALNIGIFDINCINNGSGWVSLDDWCGIVVPWITEGYPRATGKWHITHAVEIERPAPQQSETMTARKPTTNTIPT